MIIRIFDYYNKNIKREIALVRKSFKLIEEKKHFQLIFYDMEKMKEINNTYKGHNYPTDVLSFIDEEDKSTMGDVFVCMDKIDENANNYSHDKDYELLYMIVHGYLHLKGYDHENQQDEEKMTKETLRIMELFGYQYWKENKMTDNERFELLKAAMNKAYAPYSKFKVGALLVFNDGSTVMGCNIENASYGLSNCAERSAMFSAISQGYDLKNVVELSIIGDTIKPISPCGACRQVMSELLKESTPVYLYNIKGNVLKTSVAELLPYSFTDKDLK